MLVPEVVYAVKGIVNRYKNPEFFSKDVYYFSDTCTFFSFKLVMKRALLISTAVSREEVCEAFNVILTREIIQKCLALVIAYVVLFDFLRTAFYYLKTVDRWPQLIF